MFSMNHKVRPITNFEIKYHKLVIAIRKGESLQKESAPRKPVDNSENV